MNFKEATRRISVPFILGLSVLLSACDKGAAPETITSPQAQTKRFYEWYLMELAAKRVPLVDDPSGLSRHLTPSLLDELKAKSKQEGGLQQDYFLKAQDWLEEWRTDIEVLPAQITGTQAQVVLQLGKAADAARNRRLRVSLTLAAEGWKLSSVSQEP